MCLIDFIGNQSHISKAVSVIGGSHSNKVTEAIDRQQVEVIGIGDMY